MDLKLFYWFFNELYFRVISRSLFCFVVSCLTVFTAIEAQPSEQLARENAIYLEVGGYGGYGSLNYERFLFRKRKANIAARIGFGTYHLKDFNNRLNPDLIFPVGITGFYGNKHKLQIGVGQTFSSIVQGISNNFEAERATHLHANFLLGYAYQKEGSRLIVRCAYTPVIEFYKYYAHWGGVSFGFAF